jgi:hypothetical protein
MSEKDIRCLSPPNIIIFYWYTQSVWASLAQGFLPIKYLFVGSYIASCCTVLLLSYWVPRDSRVFFKLYVIGENYLIWDY